MNLKVFATYKLPGNPGALFGKEGISFSENLLPRLLRTEELIEQAAEADGIISLLGDKIDADVINKLKKCRVIANYAVGFNNIDLNAARERGITVTNTPDVLSAATAEIAFLLILAAARNLNAGEKMMRNKVFLGWSPELLLGYGLEGKTLGLVGAGRIAQKVAKMALGFGMNIIYFSRSVKPEMPGRFVPLSELMATSDVISLHIPLDETTNNLISADLLDRMKPSAIFVNTARGEVADEKHLIALLKKRNISAAGVAVYTNEPHFNHALTTLDNVVLLPHIGSATFETRTAMAHLAANNVISVLKGGEPITPVAS